MPSCGAQRRRVTDAAASDPGTSIENERSGMPATGPSRSVEPTWG